MEHLPRLSGVFNLSHPAKLALSSHITDGETEALRGEDTQVQWPQDSLQGPAVTTASALSTLCHCVPGTPTPYLQALP